jgi:hypothetical protein
MIYLGLFNSNFYIDVNSDYAILRARSRIGETKVVNGDIIVYRGHDLRVHNIHGNVLEVSFFTPSAHNVIIIDEDSFDQ